MKKILLIAGAALLAASTTSAFAQPYYGSVSGIRAPDRSFEWNREMRACQVYAMRHHIMRPVAFCNRYLARWDYRPGYRMGFPWNSYRYDDGRRY